MRNNRKWSLVFGLWSLIFLSLCVSVKNSHAQQEQPPAPGTPKSISIPAVKEKKLPNGLTVAVVERKNVPLVTVQLLIKSGASNEDLEKAGLADMTASLLTKGTKTRTATQIAEQMEFLGGSINSGAGWNNSFVTINVMSDKLDQAMAILSDLVLNPKFDQKELDLLKSQTLDSLAYNLKQPGFLANYVASSFTFAEHPAGGTPESIKNISRGEIVDFHKKNYTSDNAVLIFAGDITNLKANTLAQKFFDKWQRSQPVVQERFKIGSKSTQSVEEQKPVQVIKRLLVIDLPNSGQASVNYLKSLDDGRVEFDDNDKAKTSPIFYPSLVMNSVLGGGYSSRLNLEIRIKRGLSYGAGSNFAWRENSSNFSTRTQTKNESAAEVAELVMAEIQKLMDASVPETELVPRKATLTGDFERDLETTGGLADAVASLYTFGLPTAELNSHTQNIRAVTDAQIRQFAAQNLKGGDIIIVGDYSVFKDDLAKRFPNMQIEVIKADELDLSKENLRK